VPALGDEPEQRAKGAREEPPLVEQDIEIVLCERLAPLHRLKGAADRNQHQNVDEGIANRNLAEALVLMMPPTAFIESRLEVSAVAANATPTDRNTMTAE
jgi:hypothetical protein